MSDSESYIHENPKKEGIGKMRILKSKKALSPVVASIILIAVTVAVSIAVAAWMGALTFTFTATEQLQITKIDFLENQGIPTDEIEVTVLNTGTTPVTITEARVNGIDVTMVDDQDQTLNSVTIKANQKTTITLKLSQAWERGYNYEVKLMSSKGNPFMRTETAPTG
jgi:flagellin-like protein